MEDVNVKIDLDLDDAKARQKLEEFKNNAKSQDIKIKLDLSDIKADTNKIGKSVNDAFKVGNLKDLDKLEKKLKDVNKIIREQNELAKKNSSSNGKSDFGIKINTKTNIIKDIKTISDDYKKAKDEIKELDSYGKEIRDSLNKFNKSQEQAFKKFQSDSKGYDKYLDNLTSVDMSKGLKQLIRTRRKQMQYQSELANLGVVKVNNDKTRNQMYDNSLFVSKNEGWKAMFAKSASEAKEIEDKARELQPKILGKNKTIKKYINDLSKEEKEIYEQFEKAFSERPTFNMNDHENENLQYMRLMLQSSMKDADKIGLDFDKVEHVYEGLNRHFARLQQVQNEFNSKFSNQKDFKAIQLDSLKNLEDSETKENISKIDANNELLEKALKERDQILRQMYDVKKQDRPKNIDQGLDSSIKEYLSVVKKIESLNAELHKAETQKDTRVANALREEMQLYQRKQVEITSNIRANNLLTDSVKKLVSEEEKLAQARTKTKNSRVDSSNFKEQESELIRLHGQLTKYHSMLGDIENKLSHMSKSKGFLDQSLLLKTNELLSRTKQSLNVNGIESDFNRIQNSVKKLNDNLKNLNNGNTLSKQEASFNIAYSNMQNRLEKFIHSIQGMKGSENVIERLAHDFNSIRTDNIERASVSLREFGSQLNKAGHEMKQLNGGGLFSKFGKDFKENLFTFTGGELLADGIRNSVSAIKDSIMDLDNAYTELRKVLDEPLDAKGLKALSREATSTAKETAQSSGDFIRTTADIVQFAGKNIGESKKVAKQTMKLMNVTGMSREDASKGVATLISAFGNEIKIGQKVTIGHGKQAKSVDQLTNSFDKLNWVGNKYAISSDGVVDALQAGGSVLATTGVDLSHTIAMITASNKALQDPRRVGNGLKTINNKLLGMKTNAKDGTLELNKTAKSLKEIAGVDVYSNKKKGELKSSTQILEETAKKWNTLTEAQKAGLSEAIAGQEQSAVFQSLMTNFKDYESVVKDFDAGKQFNSMDKENQQFVNSMAGQLNRLKETWLGIWNELGANELFAGALKGLNMISDAIAKLVNSLSDLGVLKPMIGMLAGLLAFKQAKGLLDTAKGLKSIGDVIKGLGKGSSEITTVGESIAGAMGGIGGSTRNATREVREIGDVAYTVGDKIKGFGTNVKTFMSTPLGVFSGYAVGATVGVYAIAKAYDYFNETSAEQSKRTGDLVKNRQKEVNATDSQIKKLQDIQKEYDKLNGKQDKSKEDLKRLKELNNEIAKIRPDLVVGKDSNGNAILAMTGDVKTLVEELKNAKKEKQELLKDAMVQDSTSQVRARQNKKEVGGIEGGSQALGVTNTLNDMQRLQEATVKHKNRMEYLEEQRDKAIVKMQNSTGKERKKALDDFNKTNVEILKEQDNFNKDYDSKLKVVKETSANLGKSLFGEIENSASFNSIKNGDLKKQFSDLKSQLDFSDIQTPEKLKDAREALSRLLDSAEKGKINLGDLKKSLSDANTEFKKTGDIKQYRKTINELVDDVNKKTGIKKNILTNLFEGLNEGAGKSKSAIEKFLNAYNKSANDLANNDSFAIALATQQQHIETGIEKLQKALDSGDLKYKKDVLIEISNDKDVPTQVRTMIQQLMDAGADTGKTLELAQDVMIDMKDGKIDNVEEFNKRISELTKGKVKFKLNPDMSLSENASKAGVDTVIKQLNDRFKDVPTTVTTVIKAEGITAFNDAKKIYEEYKKIPPEVRTAITNNGLETSQSIHTVDSMLRNLPPEVVTEILNNFPDAVANSKSYQDVLHNLPPEVVSEIIVNGDPTTAEAIKKAIETLPMNKDVTISVLSGLASGNIDQVKNSLSSLPPEKRMEVIANIQNALQGINTVEGKELKDKLMALLADPSLALDGIGKVNNTPMSPKNTKVTQTGAEVVQGGLNRINNTPNKHHQTKASQSGSENVKRLLDAIMKIKNKTHRTNAIKIGADNVLSTLQNIMNVPNSKRITVTTVFNQIGSFVKGVAKRFTGAGSIEKDGKIVRNISQELNVQDAESPIPQGVTTGAVESSVQSTVSAPMPTSATPTGGVSATPSASPVPSGVSTGATTQNSGINDGQIIPSFEFDINLLSGMENNLKRVGSQLDIINTKIKNTFGSEKNRLLEEQNKLYAEQRFMQEELYKAMSRQQSALKNQLRGFGLWFDGDRVVNDVDLLLQKEREVKNLEKQTNADKEGKNEGLRKQYESQKESLDKLKKTINEYNNLTYDKIPKSKEEWEKLNNQIKETNIEILKAKYELSNLRVDIKIEKFDNEVKRVSSELSILDKEIDNAFGRNKSTLLERKIELLRNQQDEVRNLSRAYQDQANIQSDLLKAQGFLIDQQGKVLNPERLQDFAGSDMYTYLKEQLNSYNDLVVEKIPKLTVDVWNLQGEIKKSYEDQLKVTKDMQDKIADVYKKDIEERKKLIDEESKAKIDSINKEKDAYNKSRKEMDYKNEVDDQKKAIMDIQAEIEKARRDSSVSGQKMLQDLNKDLEEANKKLQDLVQNKLDDEMNESLQQQADRVNEEADRKKDQLDKEYSDENIQKLVDQALKSGVFTNIDGEVSDLQSVLIAFVNKTSEGMSALGGVIKNDLISNLQLAEKSFGNIAGMYSELGMDRFYQDTSITPTSIGNSNATSSKNVTVQFNQPLVVANTVTRDALPDLEKMISEAEKRITENITKKM